jgi:hypothetical protein
LFFPSLFSFAIFFFFLFWHRLNINNHVLSLLLSTLLSFLGIIRSAAFFPCKVCLSTEMVGSKV